MSAKERYYKWAEVQPYISERVADYIAELEQQKAEMIEMLQSISGVAMGRIKFYVDNLLSKISEADR